MIRTRDLLVLVIAIILSLFIGGLFFVGSGPSQENTIRTPSEVILVSPRDAYNVSTSTKESIRDGREAFIQKVRDSYVPEDVPAQKQDDTPLIFESDTPPPEITTPQSDVTTTTPSLVPAQMPVGTVTTTL